MTPETTTDQDLQEILILELTPDEIKEAAALASRCEAEPGQVVTRYHLKGP